MDAKIGQFLDSGCEREVKEATDGGSKELTKECMMRALVHSRQPEDVQRGIAMLQAYYLARRTALEMLRDRGYEVSPVDIDFSLQEFREVYGERPDLERLRISVQHHSDSFKKFKVVFCGTGLVKVNAIRGIASDVRSEETITGLILVLQNHVTNQALKAIELFPFKVEIFQITDLLVNITKHVLKPQHRVLNDKEKETLLKKYSIEDKQVAYTYEF